MERARKAANPKPPSESAVAWRLANRELQNARIRDYYAANPDKLAVKHEKTKAWLKENPDRAKAHHRAKWERWRKDPAKLLGRRVRTALWRRLSENKGDNRWFEVLGYTVEDLYAHLERQFLKGMSWENMGEWHIDHIVPLSKCPASSPDDPNFKRVWALTNLRPLWAKDNLSKGARIQTLL